MIINLDDGEPFSKSSSWNILFNQEIYEDQVGISLIGLRILEKGAAKVFSSWKWVKNIVFHLVAKINYDSLL